MKTETRYYMGRRIVGKVLKHHFHTPDGVVFYPKARAINFVGLKIGRGYMFPEDSKGGFSLPEKGTWDDNRVGEPPHDDAETWQIEERLDIQLQKSARDPVDPELASLITKLQFYVRAMPRHKRSQLVAYLIDKLML